MPIALVLALSAALFVPMKGARIVMTLFAVDLGAGPLETGLLFALHGLFPFLFSVVAGRVADRIDNRVLMYWGLAGYALVLTLPFFVPRLYVLFVTAALAGLATMLFVVATQNLVGVLSTPESRTRNYSYYSLGESSGNVAGPVLVGISIDTLSHPLTFALLAAYVVACGAVLAVKRESIPAAARPAAAAERRSMKDLLALPAMRSALLTNGVVMAGLDLFNLYMPVYGRDIGLSATVIGIIIGCFGTATFVTRLFIPWFTGRYGERAMLFWALALAALAFFTFPLTHSPWLLAAGAFALGLGLGCGQPLSTVLAFNAAPPGRSAEGISMRLMVSYAAHVVIPPVFGALGAGLGVAPIFWASGVLLSGGSVLNRRRAPPR